VFKSVVDKNAELVFAKLRENEKQNKEDNPIDANDKEEQPFYRGCLIFKNGAKIEYFRLLQLNQFVYNAFIPREILDKTGSVIPTLGIMDINNWIGRINDELSYTPAEKSQYTGLPDHVEYHRVIYESQNARQYGYPLEGEEPDPTITKCEKPPEPKDKGIIFRLDYDTALGLHTQFHSQ
jgi:hypothetical protein